MATYCRRDWSPPAAAVSQRSQVEVGPSRLLPTGGHDAVGQVPCYFLRGSQIGAGWSQQEPSRVSLHGGPRFERQKIEKIRNFFLKSLELAPIIGHRSRREPNNPSSTGRDLRAQRPLRTNLSQILSVQGLPSSCFAGSNLLVRPASTLK